MFSLGVTLPGIYMPSYAVDLGYSKTMGSALVTIMNGETPTGFSWDSVLNLDLVASSIFGKLFVGMLSDRVSLRTTILLSAVGGALSCFFLFGFATSLPTLVIFVIAWGLTALGYSSLITRTVTYICKDDPHTPMVIFSIFTFSQGVAMISSGPIASALLHSGVTRLRFGYGVQNYVSDPDSLTSTSAEMRISSPGSAHSVDWRCSGSRRHHRSVLPSAVGRHEASDTATRPRCCSAVIEAFIL